MAKNPKNPKNPKFPKHPNPSTHRTPPTTDVLGDLDRLLGAAVVMDLTHRGLLPLATTAGDPAAGGGVGARPATAPLLDPTRAQAAVLGAAIGNALGRPTRYRTAAQVQQRYGRVTGYLPWAGWRSGPVGTVLAEAQLMQAYAGAVGDHGLGAARACSDQLLKLLSWLREPGPAIVETTARRQQGWPWFTAGPGSFGASALLRAVVDGVAYPADPTCRSASACLGAIVTHAHPTAVAGSIVVATAVGALLTDPAIPNDVLIARLSAICPDTTLAAAVADAGTQQFAAHAVSATPTVIEVLPAALACFVQHPDPRDAMLTATNAGGASHLTTALVGALVGARHGVAGFDPAWVAGVEDRVGFETPVDAIVRRCWTNAGTDAAVNEPDAVGGDEHAMVDGSPAHIWFLLDRSGSMQDMRDAVVDGFNTFVDEQRAVAAPAVLTLAQFDSEDPYEVLLDAVALGQLRRFDGHRYQPRGMTPLYDAIGSLIDQADARIATRRAAGKRPEDQVVVVFTDGAENDSRTWTRGAIFARIEACKTKGWTVVFLGANQDSYETGGQLGVAGGSVSNYDASADGMRTAWSSVSRSMSVYRAKGTSQRAEDRDDFFDGQKEAEHTTSR